MESQFAHPETEKGKNKKMALYVTKTGGNGVLSRPISQFSFKHLLVTDHMAQILGDPSWSEEQILSAPFQRKGSWKTRLRYLPRSHSGPVAEMGGERGTELAMRDALSFPASLEWAVSHLAAGMPSLANRAPVCHGLSLRAEHS